ncbi:hypothetical protein D9M72_585050 [compost metagenome]
MGLIFQIDEPVRYLFHRAAEDRATGRTASTGWGWKHRAFGFQLMMCHEMQQLAIIAKHVAELRATKPGCALRDRVEHGLRVGR